MNFRRNTLYFGIALLVVASWAGAEIIPLQPGESGFSVAATESGDEELLVSVAEIEVTGVEIDGRTWAVARVPGASNFMDRGLPSLPYLVTEYLLDRQGGVQLELIDLVEREIDLNSHGYAGVAPSKGHFDRSIDPDTVSWTFEDKVYGGDDLYPNSAEWVDTPFIAGPIRGQALRVAAARWDPKRNLLRVVEQARYRVVHTADAANPRLGPERPMTGLFDRVSSLTAVNYDLFNGRYVPVVETGRLLILAYDDFVDEIADLAAWHTLVGYETVVTPLSTVGSTSIEIAAYIQGLYDEPEGLSWIILVGDYPQIINPAGVNEGARCDSCYTKLEGSDNRPDAAISRISATTGAEVTLQVQKILDYERYPDEGSSAGAWYTGAMGIASNEGSPTDYERMNDLRDLLLADTYTEFAELYDGISYPNSQDVADAVNQGISLGLYIGHGAETYWVSSGFSVSDVNSLLSNGSMLPVVWDVACVNGAFHRTGGDCFAEAWMKKADGGAVSFEAATTNEDWVPPCIAQRGIVDSIVERTALTTGGQHITGKLVLMDAEGDDTYDAGTRFMEQSTLFGSCTMWPRTAPPLHPDEPLDYAAAGGIASLTVTVGGQPITTAGAAIVSFYTPLSEGIELHGSGLIDVTGQVQAAIDGEPTHCHIHGRDLVPQSFELAARPDGRVTLDRTLYPCKATVGIRVSDSNVPGSSGLVVDTLDVTLGNGVDSTVVNLTETKTDSGVFAGSAELRSDLVVDHGQTLTATYLDADTGEGLPVSKNANAAIDCLGPLVTNVVTSADQGSLTVSFDTDEASLAVVRYGTSVPPMSRIDDDTMSMSHSVTLEGLDPCTTYFVQITAIDSSDNAAVDTNGGDYYSEQTAGWTSLLAEDFSTDPGWVVDNDGAANGWVFGTPTGGGGSYGNPDPTAGHTGDSVYGVNLSGDYDNNLSTDQVTLEMPALDCSEATSVELRYWRWLGVEKPDWDHARLQVSTGGAWFTVWENSAEVADAAWSEQVHDLSSLAAGQSDVRIRWTLGSTDGSWQFCGWNIDDVEVFAAVPCAPEFTGIFADGFENGDCSAWSIEVP